MTKLLTTAALALMISAPAFAQDPAPLNTENADRANANQTADDATDLMDDEVGFDDDFFYFRDADNRRLRVRRDRFMANDANEIMLNTENADREAAEPTAQ